MLTDDIAAAFRQALNRELLGIEQIDAELTEDARCVLLYGHTSDPSVTYIASLPIPGAIEWCKA
ncbi:hypothetical protein Q4543_04690 [Salipiger sp. 1_MG-2023]|uniref:hypothetical protein n=1 Tax=Salipiger sp. 1_MG-2023 TaxID=3062665 RepID=UPI0026E1FD24|nr:hypothetical protein [Salipiger sp. 1_MG-2023]MDO6584809.1 hypothetical protein [Salipiger sp. 1_MG-2023]